MKVEDSPYIYSGAICIVDARTFLAEVDAISNQIQQAHMVVINKSDLVEDTSIIRDRITVINPNADIHRTTFGKIGIEFFQRDGNSLKETNKKRNYKYSGYKTKDIYHEYSVKNIPL